eukprot:GHVT01062510.1.p1 GENE.GHVT01062510.1~~GHVT01062510.1.p1  ORF type:complete len:237 (-),score=40.04 GHVT01062510.1:1001-1711(-)
MDCPTSKRRAFPSLPFLPFLTFPAFPSFPSLLSLPWWFLYIVGLFIFFRETIGCASDTFLDPTGKNELLRASLGGTAPYLRMAATTSSTRPSSWESLNFKAANTCCTTKSSSKVKSSTTRCGSRKECRKVNRFAPLRFAFRSQSPWVSKPTPTSTMPLLILCFFSNNTRTSSSSYSRLLIRALKHTLTSWGVRTHAGSRAATATYAWVARHGQKLPHLEQQQRWHQLKQQRWQHNQ